MRDIEGILEATSEELSFTIWYMKQRAWITSDDKSALQITADGMDYLDAHPPAPAAVMSCIKAAAGGGQTAAPAPAEPASQIIWQETAPPPPSPPKAETRAVEEARQPMTILQALNRALAAADQRSAAAAELLEQNERGS